MATGEMEVLLEVRGFEYGQRWGDDHDPSTYCCLETSLGGGGVPSELDTSQLLFYPIHLAHFPLKDSYVSWQSADMSQMSLLLAS